MSKQNFADDYFEEAPGCAKWNSGLYKALDHSKKQLVVTGGWDSGLFKTVESHKRRYAPERWDKTLPKDRPLVHPHDASWEPKAFPRRQWPVHEDGWDSGLHKTLPNDPRRREHVGGWDSGLHKTLPNTPERSHQIRSFADKGPDPSDTTDIANHTRPPIRRDSWATQERKTVSNAVPMDKAAGLHGKQRANEGTGWDSGLFKTIPNDTESTAARLKARRAAEDAWQRGDKTFHDPPAVYRVKATGEPVHNYDPSRPGVIHEQPRGRRFAYSRGACSTEPILG